MAHIFFVGTYTEPIRFGTGELYRGQGRGIYTCALEEDGALRVLDCREGVQNPSYLCMTADRRFLYCVNELKDDAGKSGGQASAFRVRSDWALAPVNTEDVGGADPCHIALSPQEDALYVSNFMSGSVTTLERRADGGLSPARQIIRHEGSSIVPGRQDGPHAHSLAFDPAGEFAYVPDLGADKIFIYRRSGGALLAPAPTPWLSTFAGSGPRHLIFGRGGKLCYLINELASSVSVFAVEGLAWRLLQTISTLPEGYAGQNICADIHLSQDEGLLFGSNRGHDSIATFRVSEDGTLASAAWMSSGGGTPRNFAVDPSGKFLVVCNQTSNNICTFEIDFERYRHAPCSSIEVGSPVCAKFLP